ncbi:hypothetical protein [Streptomyces sp. NPDC099088]|uniref:hypothetical protein n=1 Tax=Streptomyces sp. NPDC099088 TaxID=3366101 RepID=UPI003801A190
MDLIDEFLSRYAKEYDFYSQAARLSAQALERDLRTSGIRCIVTHRAKDAERLENKCRQRESLKGGYSSIGEIFEDVVDLAGVRVALYFPGELDQVDKVVNRLFRLVEPKKEFPSAAQGENGKRFSGYSAVHYRVHLAGQGLSETDKRYMSARVEIQVASVLMHAWSEVEHDLVYKPLSGDLSAQELAILDQLNGLVIAGELSLQMLQEAGEARVADAGGSFLNHYELAAHLLSHATGLRGEPVEAAGLGRIDLLFELLTRLNISTPAQLAPYLESLHDNLEERPLAEQVIDAVLAEDISRYAVFESVAAESRDPSGVGVRDQGNRHHELTGNFLAAWIDLEDAIRNLVPVKDQNMARVPLKQMIRQIPDLDEKDLQEILRLQQIRNSVVHRPDVQTTFKLRHSVEALKALTTRIRGLRGPDSNSGVSD